MKDKITFVLIVGVMVYVNLDGYLYLNIYPKVNYILLFI